MARIVTCGWELNVAALPIEPTVETNPLSVPSSSVRARSGTYAARCSSFVSGQLKRQVFTFATKTILFYRVYVWIDTLPSIEVGFIGTGPSGTYTHYLSVDSSGTLRTYYKNNGGTYVQVSGTTALATGQWYRIEFTHDITTQTNSSCTSYVDGAVSATGSGLSVFAASVGQFIVGGNLIGEANAAGDWYFDDLAVNDNSGANQTSLPGAGSVVYLRPNGPGDADTGGPTRGGTDSGSIEGQLDEITPNDATDYVILPVNPSDVWVDVENLPAGVSTVTLVEVHGRVTGANSTASNWFPQIESQSAGTKVAGTTTVLATTSWFTNDDTATAGNSKLTSYTDPQAGGAWTSALVNAMQISAKTTDGNPDTWVSTLWAIVEYVPAVTSDPAMFLMFPQGLG